MIVFRQADPRFPFVWGTADQPPGRWHAAGEGPAHYFADTPAGAWAELLRHEEITDLADVVTLRRAMWAVDIGTEKPTAVTLPLSASTGDRRTYDRCQKHARDLRATGCRRLVAPSAALVPGGATGRHVVDAQERPADARDGHTIVVFGAPDELVGWQVVERGSPPHTVLPLVRHF
jgi:RES domain